MVKAKTGGSDDTKQSVPTAYVLSYCKEPKNIIQSVTEFVKIKLILDYSSWSRAGVHIDVNLGHLYWKVITLQSALRLLMFSTGNNKKLN